MSTRLKKLRLQLKEIGIDAFLVTFQPHLRYLTGFSGSSGGGLATHRTAYLFTDGRYAEQVKDEVKDWNIIVSKDGVFEEVKRRNLIPNGTRVGFDGNTVVFSQFKLLRKMFPKVKFLPKVDCIEKIAVVKDAEEIAKIKTAVAITDQVFSEILTIIKPGVTELDIAAEISYRQRKHGAEADAFEAIVATGVRSALPHGRATTKKVLRGDLVTLDFGCTYKGYHSDMTRTVIVGRPSPDARKIYNIVLDAQARAIDAARSGMKTKDLDAVARSYIKKMGYERNYRHSLGHGIGLQVHEPPRISMFSSAVLEKGNVVTIEPGIYVPNLGGVRIEDDVVITNDHCEVLNRSPKELLIL